MQPLNERLQEWFDIDVAQYQLGVLLGLFDEGIAEDSSAAFRAKKWIFWTNNPLGNALYEMLEQLKCIGILERNDECQYRWNRQVAENLMKKG